MQCFTQEAFLITQLFALLILDESLRDFFLQLFAHLIKYS